MRLEIGMFRIKTFKPRLSSETILCLILLGLTFVSSAFHITFVYGITFSFTSIFIFLLFRLYGLPLAIFTTLLSFLFIPHTYIFVIYNIILLLEILFVGTYFYVKKRAKMFFVDGFFWLTIGFAALFLINKPVLAGDALYFQIFLDTLNGLFNILIADMLLAYFPFYKLLKSRLNKNNVSIHQFLSHITIISIMIPFFLIILTKTWTAHEFISNDSKKQAEKAASKITKELLLFNHNKLSRFSLHDSELQNKLEVLVKEHKSAEFNIVITDEKNNIITSCSSVKVKNEEYYNWEKMNDIREISTNFYEVLPKDHNDVLPINKWRSGKLVFIDSIDPLSFKVFVQFPIAQYQDSIFKEFLFHLKISIIFALFTMIFVMVVSRLFMANLKRLTIVTTGLPQKLINQEKVDWPNSNISELRLLTQNLKEMAQKLKELFQESTEMNRILTSQTKKLKESEDKLQQLAYYDVLTSLPNRLHFQNYVRNLIKNKHSGYIGVIFIDLNQFKQVNDTFGHDAGDVLLQQTASRLSTFHNENREIFRLGGDEFVIVHEIEEREQISDTLKKISNEFSSPFIINGQILYVSVSVGISLYPDDGRNLDTLVKCADIAMYVSKEKGGNAAQFFNDTMRGKYHERLLIENSLRNVVDHGGFKLFYQPKMQCNEVTSLEVLLRWYDPALGNVPPSTFIPIAEEIGLISQIDEWVLIEACKQNKQWQEEHLPKVPISVNISAKNFQHDHLISLIEKALDESGMNPKYLKLEITESVFIKDPKHVADVINKIKSLGVLISIDDFGKGFSSLIHLLQLPIDEIKIDKQFITEIDQNEKKALLVKSMIDIAHGFHLNIVAEGIETKYERDLLIELGCDELQGYLFSPPISPNEMKKFLSKTNTYLMHS